MWTTRRDSLHQFDDPFGRGKNKANFKLKITAKKKKNTNVSSIVLL